MLKVNQLAFGLLAGLVVFTCTPALAQFGRGGFGGGRGGVGPLGLLRIPEVRQEIDLMPDQEEALQKLNEKMGELMGRGRGERGERGDRGGFGGFTDEQRQQMEKTMQEMNAQLEQILLPPQMDRLKEIELQQMGASALQNEDVQSKLNLTAEQKQKLQQIGQEMQSEWREAFAAARESGGFGAIREKMEEMRANAETESMEVLTAEQKQQFEKMKGEPFDMPERGGFGGRRGGPGGRGDDGDRPQRPRRPNN